MATVLRDGILAGEGARCIAGAILDGDGGSGLGGCGNPAFQAPGA